LIVIGFMLVGFFVGQFIAGAVAIGLAAANGAELGDILNNPNSLYSYMSLTEAVQRLRGKPGTKVEITIERKGEEFKVTITRAIIHIESVIPNNYHDTLKFYSNEDELGLDMWYGDDGMFSKIILRYYSSIGIWDIFKQTIEHIRSGDYHANE